jgi:threonylcarbamoyladenosine tRNA methylthiotransferase MtaB
MPTFHIHQFGCRATQADAAAIERQLLTQGHTLAESATASDIVVVNTCTVTASADAQARDAIRKIHAQNPHAKIIATGCYAQRAPEDLAALPGVTHVVGNSHKPEIPALIAKISQPRPVAPSNFIPAHQLSAVDDSSCRGAAPLRPSLPGPNDLAATPGFLSSSSHSIDSPKILTADIFTRQEFLSAPILGGESHHTRPTLKIQDGCNLRCSYCVIPFVRGKSRSLPPNEVLQEIRNLAQAGYKEIVLSGINLGTYGRDLSPRIDFEDLLRRILDETEIPRLRISSIEPLDVTQDLIALFASTNRIAQHFHMPLQSASDKILAAMHRWYRAEHYARRLDLIREHLPHAAIGADVIAGFPGESPADHAATLDFIDRLPFTYLHVFSYSARPGTKAASLAQQIPAATIHHRARELRSLSEKKSAAFRHSHLHTTHEVLTLNSKPVGAGFTPPGESFNHGVSDDSPLSTAQNPSPHTPAISTNYLHLRLAGTFPPNQLLRAKITHHENGILHASPETKINFAVHRPASHL